MKIIGVMLLALFSASASARSWSCKIFDKNGVLIKEFDYDSTVIFQRRTIVAAGLEWKVGIEGDKLGLRVLEVTTDGRNFIRHQAQIKKLERDIDFTSLQLVSGESAHCDSSDVRALFRKQEREDEDIEAIRNGTYNPAGQGSPGTR